MIRTRLIMVAACVFIWGTNLNAQIVIDGERDASYELAAVQTVETGFGNNLSEWNAAYTKVESGRLFVMLTGNIEANFNKLEVFFDSKEGGENVLDPTPDYDFTPDGTNWISTNLGGLTFDTPFAADYHLYMRAGSGVMDVDMADRDGGTEVMIRNNTAQSAYGGAIGDTTSGSIEPGNLGANSAGDAIQFDIPYAHNNSNTEGIGDDNGMAFETGAAADQEAALAVTTGFEFSIDVRDLGIDPSVGGTVKINVFQNGAQHDFASNQCFAGLPVGTGNLGGDGAGNFTGNVSGVNFNDFADDQFFSVEIPPSAGGTTFCPTSFNVFRGILLAGDLDSLCGVDGNTQRYNPGLTINAAEAPVWPEVFGNVGAGPGPSTSLSITSQAGTPGLTYTVEARNYNTGGRDVIGTQAESFNNDQTVTFPLTSDQIDANGDVESRIGWRKTGLTINFPWEVRIDDVTWIVQ